MVFNSVQINLVYTISICTPTWTGVRFQKGSELSIEWLPYKI